MINNAFPTLERDLLRSNPEKVAKAVSEFGVCYIKGFEREINNLATVFEELKSDDLGSIRLFSKGELEKKHTTISNVTYSNEFNQVKNKLLGRFCRKNIETFIQSTGETTLPASGHLHFDKRRTIKIWAYIGDVTEDTGPMRVVPCSKSSDFNTAAIRSSLTRGERIDKTQNAHYPPDTIMDRLEASAEMVTGAAGTLFIHDTDAWHGASTVKKGFIRKIIRSHNRPFKDFFL